MVLAAKPKTNPKELKTKYHQLKQQLEATYGLMQGRIISKFNTYDDSYKLDKTRSLLKRLIEKSSAAYLNERLIKEHLSLKDYSKRNRNQNNYKEEISWTRNRFNGELVQIVIEKGLVVEKVFKTPKGSLIIIKRSELGFSLLIKIKNLINRILNY